MTDIFLSVFEVSVSISPIIAVLVLLTPFLNKRYATKWKYWIWIFLALRLIIPYSGLEGTAIADLLPQIKTQDALEAEKNNTAHVYRQSELPARIIVELPTQMTIPIAVQSEKNNSGITLLDIAAIIWIIGSLAFLSVHVVSYYHYKRRVIKRGTPIKDTRILHLILKLERELHIKCRVSAIEYPGAISPMIMGFFRPVLVLPKEQYTSEELFFILKHEFVHLKRKDVYMRLLFVTANAVHWFNPLVFMMQKEADIDMELSCDERVTKGADYRIRRAYTETLLSTLQKQCTKKNVLSTQFYGGKKIMKRRFKNILLKTEKKNGTAIWITSVFLTVCFSTLTGCSIAKVNTESVVRQTENKELSEETDLKTADENGTEHTPDVGNIPVDHELGQSKAAENEKMLTIMKEGEPEEKHATLAAGDGYSFYLPDGEWHNESTNLWYAAVNEDVQLWVARYKRGDDAEQILADVGYETENGGWMKQEGSLIYKVKMHESGDDVWCVFYRYPAEAEEGWGNELPVIADTFAVTISDIDG